MVCVYASLVGPVRSGPVRSGPVRSGPVRSGPVRSGPVRSGPVRSGPVSRSVGQSVSRSVGQSVGCVQCLIYSTRVEIRDMKLATCCKSFDAVVLYIQCLPEQNF